MNDRTTDRAVCATAIALIELAQLLDHAGDGEPKLAPKLAPSPAPAMQAA